MKQDFCHNLHKFSRRIDTLKLYLAMIKADIVGMMASREVPRGLPF